MSRRRNAAGGVIYHAINRGNGRAKIFAADGDYAAFEDVLAEALTRVDARLLAYCLMPNHWHMLLWPRADGDLSRFVGWVTMTHAQRWHAFHKTGGLGHLYQGRFKSFPVAGGGHLWSVCRYIERNPLRAGLVQRAEDWPWSSLRRRTIGGEQARAILTPWPRPYSGDWVAHVNQPQSEAELEALRLCVARGRPFGPDRWQAQTAELLGLQATLRNPGRPRKVR